MSDVNIWGGTGTGGAGITLPLSVSQGGTGSIDVVSARTSLGVPSVADLTLGLAGKASITATDGALVVPAGTTAQRDVAPQEGWIRRNKTLAIWEGYDGTSWVPLGTGSGGGGTGTGAINGTFYESVAVLTADYTVATGSNSMVAGPITVPDGITILIPDGSVLTIV